MLAALKISTYNLNYAFSLPLSSHPHLRQFRASSLFCFYQDFQHQITLMLSTSTLWFLIPPWQTWSSVEQCSTCCLWEQPVGSGRLLLVPGLQGVVHSDDGALNFLLERLFTAVNILWFNCMYFCFPGFLSLSWLLSSGWIDKHDSRQTFA